jgi:predicted nucleotidyltransferase
VKDKVQQHFHLHYEEVSSWVGTRGKVAMLSLQGSQNYGTHTGESDIDSKAVIIPSFLSILKKESLYKDMDISNGEKCSIKEFPDFIKMFFKGNVNALEMLFTDHYFFNDASFRTFFLSKIVPCREQIVQATYGTIQTACIGMMKQKLKSMSKPTEGCKTFFAEHGYNHKDVIHINRLYRLLESLCNDSTFLKAMDFSFESEWVKAVRIGVFDLTTVKAFSEMRIDQACELTGFVDNSDLKEKLYNELNMLYIGFLEQRYT